MALKQLFVITGATGGIGSAAARRLAHSDSGILLHGYSRTAELNKLAQEINAEPAAADLSTPAGIEELFTKFEEWCSAQPLAEIHTISFIFAAGTDLMSPAMKTLSFDERMEKITALDLYAPIRLARRFAAWHAQMRSGCQYNDSVLFFSWDGAERGMEGDTAQLYAFTKGGIASFARSFAQDQNGKIRALTISPGWIATTWGKQASKSANKRVCFESLSQRWGTPEEVAELAAFLVSENAAYLNGVNIPLNGGFNFTQYRRDQ